MFRFIPLIVICIALYGCKSHTVIDKHEQMPMSIESGDSVVLLGRSTRLAESGGQAAA